MGLFQTLCYTFHTQFSPSFNATRQGDHYKPKSTDEENNAQESRVTCQILQNW